MARSQWSVSHSISVVQSTANFDQRCKRVQGTLLQFQSSQIPTSLLILSTGVPQNYVLLSMLTFLLHILVAPLVMKVSKYGHLQMVLHC